MPPVLSHVTERYLNCFDGILRELIRTLGSLPPGKNLGRMFMNQLLPLHCTAGEMCKNLLLYTTCLPLQELGEECMAYGEKSMETLTALLQKGNSPLSPETQLVRYLRRSRQVLDTMVYRMGSARTNNDLNANFMKQMLPLQQAIGDLCRTALGLGDAAGAEGERQLQQAEKTANTLRMLLSVVEGC